MKATSDRMLEEMAHDFNQFLKYGNLRPYLRQLDPNLNIDNIAKLLRIHFVLTQQGDSSTFGVIDFVKELPPRLRRIKKTVTKNTEMLEGEVKGRINWKETVKHRYNRNPENQTLFVCDEREINYNVAENLVLKRLLQIIHGIIYRDLKVAFDKRYEWLKGWIEGTQLKKVLNELFLRNVYLKRVDLSDVVVTERMISRAEKSRSVLYREAADLLRRYNKLMNYELDTLEAKELLNNTFIAPDRIDTLFELYWTIKIVGQYSAPTFHLIESGSKAVAKWSANGYEYKIYHNSVGSFEFREKMSEIVHLLKDRDNYFGRQIKIFEKIEQLTGMKTDSLWGGRPDIVLEKYDETGKLLSIFIGEVKYTQDPGYAIQGLRELLEYIALIKYNEAYVEEYKDLFAESGRVTGCLFLDHMEDDKPIISENCGVQIMMFGQDIDTVSNLLQ